MTHNIISGKEWAEHVLKNLGLDSLGVRRFVIEATVGEPVRIFIEGYGDARLLNVNPPEPYEVSIEFGERTDNENPDSLPGPNALDV